MITSMCLKSQLFSKIIINLCCLLCFMLLSVPHISYAQNQASNQEISSNDFKSFILQGGIFYDYGKEEYWGQEFNLSHLSFNKIGMGGIKFEKNQLELINLDISFYQATLQYELNEQLVDGLEKSKFVIDWEYFRSLKKHKEFQNNLHLGYLLSCQVENNKNSPLLADRFKTTLANSTVGLGGKAFYAVPLGKKNSFYISTELNLIDVGISSLTDSDPAIAQEFRTQNTFFDIKILRPRIGIDFGLVL